MHKNNQLARFPWGAVCQVAVLLLLAAMCVRLSVWQRARWLEKKQLTIALAQAKQHPPQTVSDWTHPLPAFHRVRVSGQWVADRQLLVANQLRSGRYGYDVITPLRLPNSDRWVLVDRGWVAANRDYQPPDVSLTVEPVNLTAYVFYPSGRHVIVGDVWLSSTAWPRTAQVLSPLLFAKALGHPVLPFVLRLEQPTSLGYDTHWVLLSFPASRHLSYMIQWLVFAGLLLVGAVLIGWKAWRKRRDG